MLAHSAVLVLCFFMLLGWSHSSYRSKVTRHQLVVYASAVSQDASSIPIEWPFCVVSFRVVQYVVFFSSFVFVASPQVPEEEVELEVELVHCVMILLNKPQGLMTLEASSDLLPLLAVRESEHGPAD